MPSASSGCRRVTNLLRVQKDFFPCICCDAHPEQPSTAADWSVHPQTIHIPMELPVLVDVCFLFPPVVFIQSLLEMVLHVLQVDLPAPVSARIHVGPACGDQPPAQVIQVLLQHVDCDATVSLLIPSHLPCKAPWSTPRSIYARWHKGMSLPLNCFPVEDLLITSYDQGAGRARFGRHAGRRKTSLVQKDSPTHLRTVPSEDQVRGRARDSCPAQHQSTRRD